MNKNVHRVKTKAYYIMMFKNTYVITESHHRIEKNNAIVMNAHAIMITLHHIMPNVHAIIMNAHHVLVNHKIERLHHI